MLFEKFLEKLIIMWSLIRPCWVDFSSKLNRHVDMIIRATRVRKMMVVYSKLLIIAHYHSGLSRNLMKL